MPKKRLKGVVVKKSGDKTYKVEVFYTRQHPKYRKIIHIRRRFLVHSDKDIPLNTVVIIEETRRVSRHKHFKVIKVLDTQSVDTVDEDLDNINKGQND